MTHMDPNPANLINETARCLLTLKIKNNVKNKKRSFKNNHLSNGFKRSMF